MVSHDKRFTSALFLLFLCAGCIVPRSQLAELERENRRLAQESRAHRAELANLKEHAREVEDKLLSAEDDLAVYEQQSGVNRRKLANFARERERLQGLFGDDRGRVSTGSHLPLARLAQRYPQLYVDEQTGIGKVDSDVLFDSGDTRVKPDAERMLRELATLLESPEGKELNVIVVGHTDDQRIRGREVRSAYPSNWHLSSARALAVADSLREAGLSESRLGVASFAAHQPLRGNDSSEARQLNRRVEIFITSPDVPIVGMTETLGGLY